MVVRSVVGGTEEIGISYAGCLEPNLGLAKFAELDARSATGRFVDEYRCSSVDEERELIAHGVADARVGWVAVTTT